MPLRDHFHPPLMRRSKWEAIHAGWPAVMVQHLNRNLPERFVAEPRVHLGARGEIEIAAFEPDEIVTGVEGDEASSSGSGAASWAPAHSCIAVETEVLNRDEYAVRVYDIDEARRLVASIEIVSPANKDRPEHRRIFVGKCAAMLQQEVSVVIVDLVTSRGGNLYADLLEFFDEHDPSLGTQPPSVYAVACRARESRRGRHVLEAWNHILTVGQPLPELPLWLSDVLAMPLDLEATYEQTCRDLRMPRSSGGSKATLAVLLDFEAEHPALAFPCARKRVRT